MHNPNVLYSVNGENHDLVNCYYCESCNRLISQGEVRIEIDTYFCPNCLENIPSSEAFSRNFRCVNCHDCPHCMAIISIHKLDSYGDSNENNGKANYTYCCGYCNFSLDVNREMNQGGEYDMKTDKEHHDGDNLPGKNEANPDSSPRESSYSSLIAERISQLNMKSIDRQYNTDNLVKSENLDNEKDILKLSLRILEEKQNISTNLLKNKNLWRNSDKIKSLLNINNSIPASREKSNLTYKQFLNNPDAINSVYLSSRENKGREISLLPIKKKLCVQISKRCITCRRLVIKPQLNPLSQPPFRVNLSANLFLPNIRIISAMNNSSSVSSYSKVIKIRVDNLMDRQVRVDFLPEKDQNEQLSMGNSSIYSIYKIEPRSLNIEPKWDPALEQQDQQLNIPVHEKRDRNKMYINVFICESDGKHEEVELELTVVANFLSPTGNNSTVQFRIVGKANVQS